MWLALIKTKTLHSCTLNVNAIVIIKVNFHLSTMLIDIKMLCFQKSYIVFQSYGILVFCSIGRKNAIYNIFSVKTEAILLVFAWYWQILSFFILEM